MKTYVIEFTTSRSPKVFQSEDDAAAIKKLKDYKNVMLCYEDNDPEFRTIWVKDKP